jgi:hypothetical protein
MAGAADEKRRVSPAALVWLVLLAIMLGGAAVTIPYLVSPDLRRPLESRSLAGFERTTGLHFPPGAQLLFSRVQPVWETQAIVKVRMTTEQARAFLHAPPINGNVSSSERDVTNQAILHWPEDGTPRGEWQPDAVKHFVSADVAMEYPRNLWLLVDFDRPAYAIVYAFYFTT